MTSTTTNPTGGGLSEVPQGAGLQAPDTATFTWGDGTAAIEHLAGAYVVHVLERAVAGGRLQPGIAGWRTVAADLCDAALDQPVTALGLSDADGRSIRGGATDPSDTLDTAGPLPTIRQWIVLERVVDWARRPADPTLAQSKQVVAARLLVAPAMPSASVTEPMLAPMQWLLDACDPAVTLTSGQHLPKSLVIEGAERFGWADPAGRQPRSEASVAQLVALREAGRRLGYIRRTGATLTVTRDGHLLIDDVRGLWRGMCRSLGNLDPFGDDVATALGLTLLESPSTGSAGIGDVVRQIAAAGWQSGGRPLGDRHLRAGIDTVLAWWQANGLLESGAVETSDGAPDAGATARPTGLTALGRAAVLTYLHLRATSPITAAN